MGAQVRLRTGCSLGALTLLGALMLPRPTGAQQSPAPGASEPREMRLYLEFIVNERPTGHVAAVTLRGTDLHLLASDLAAAGVPTAASPRTLVAVRDIQAAATRASGAVGESEGQRTSATR